MTEIYTISAITCIKVLVLSAGGCLVQIVQIDLQSQPEWKVPCCHLVVFLDDFDGDQYPNNRSMLLMLVPSSSVERASDFARTCPERNKERRARSAAIER